MKANKMKKIFITYFYIGVNVIGLPDIFVHETRCFVEKSRFFGEKRKINFNQYAL